MSCEVYQSYYVTNQNNKKKIKQFKQGNVLLKLLLHSQKVLVWIHYQAKVFQGGVDACVD